MNSLYATLGLSRSANSDEIKAAYWALAKRSHPDVNADDKQAERRFKEINRAYEILGNPEARTAYDLELARRRIRARRRFWSAAATGAASFTATVGLVFAVMFWRQHVLIHQTPSDKPRVLASKASMTMLPSAGVELGAAGLGVAHLGTP